MCTANPLGTVSKLETVSRFEVARAGLRTDKARRGWGEDAEERKYGGKRGEEAGRGSNEWEDLQGIKGYGDEISDMQVINHNFDYFWLQPSAKTDENAE